MRALIYNQYGSANVVRIGEIEKPTLGESEVLVEVRASGVNTGDWRIRAAAFPGILAVPGRLMFGILKPRNQRLGTEFAGIVKETHENTTHFKPGDRVYGFAAKGGATAEFLSISEKAGIARLPDSVCFEEGAAIPFGALAALVFLRDFGKVRAGHRVLIVGASGGVGVYATQIAKGFGATVTGIGGPESQTLMKELGAAQAVDYTKTNPATLQDTFDIILDTVGAMSPKTALRLLSRNGLFLPLNFGLREIGASLVNPVRSRKVRIAVNKDKAEDLLQLNELIERGKLRAIIDSVYAFEDAVQAHERVETRHKKGAVVLRIGHAV